jgi:hypothetical protein
MLKVGDTQSMVFDADSDGPFWMTKAQRVSTRLDKHTGKKKTKKCTRLQLIEKLVQDGRGIPQGRISYGTAKDICEARGIPTTYEERTVIEGWYDKPKGQKQVLWERGLIDFKKLSSYSKDGPKDEEGHRDTTYSLEVLMESCLDFLQEKTSLQKLGETLGVMIEHTPKYHAELAGEGVEYDWGCAKQRYRRQPLARKKTLEKFRSLVKECFGREYLTESIVRKTARRARAYICAYQWLDNGADGLPDTAGEISLAKIEQLSKQMRTHRCAFDFDKGYIDLTSRENAST